MTPAVLADLRNVSAVRLCPEVNDTVHAFLVSGNGPYVPDTVLLYECKEGHELAEGSLELLCHKNGEWSGQAPNCTGNVSMVRIRSITYPNVQVTTAWSGKATKYTSNVIMGRTNT